MDLPSSFFAMLSSYKPVFKLTQSRPIVRVLCLPDIDRPVGGVKQLYRHVEHLNRIGWDAAVLTEAPDFRPQWFTSTAPTYSLSQSFAIGELNPNSCILLLPETYLGCDLVDFRGFNFSDFARVVFNQNAYYTFGMSTTHTLEALSNFYDSPSVLQVFSISEDTHRFLTTNIGLSDSRMSRIVNSIEPIFYPDTTKRNEMVWMPRKNPDHVEAILLSMKRASLQNSNDWFGQPILHQTHTQVSEMLNRSKIFLSFGHPEGFGLPIAEAMASGCWVVGYSGGGGNELFKLGIGDSVHYGDWASFLHAIQRAFDSFSLHPRETEFALQRQSLAVRSLYSIEAERNSIAKAWDRVLSAFYHWKHSS